MSDVQERLRSIQTRRSQAAAQRTRDEVEVENAEAALTKAKEALKTEFSVVTSDDLKSVRARLTEELESALAEAEEQLDAAGA